MNTKWYMGDIYLVEHILEIVQFDILINNHHVVVIVLKIKLK